MTRTLLSGLVLGLAPMVAASAQSPSDFTISTPSAAKEGELVTFTIDAPDAGPGGPLAVWAFGDGAIAAGSVVQHTYDADGEYDVRVAVQLPTGTLAMDAGALEVLDVPPEFVMNNTSRWGYEGESLPFRVDARDPSSADASGLVYTWDFGDGERGSGPSLNRPYADDGRYQVTATVTAPDGGSDTARFEIRVLNAPPALIGPAPSFVGSSRLVEWKPRIEDPGGDPFTVTLVSGPSDMTVDPSGRVEWFTGDTVGATPFTLRLEDDDGASTEVHHTFHTGWRDADRDGMADLWEAAHGLSVGADDQYEDADQDGMSNGFEFRLGSDPRRFDGPTAPPQGKPTRGARVTTPFPTLTWGGATDPQGDALTYDVEVYADPAMGHLLDDVRNLAADAWRIGVPGRENADLYWRVRAHDGRTAGPWSPLHRAFVDAHDTAPEAPVATWPVGGERVSERRPLLRWTPAPGGDRDEAYYRVRVADDRGRVLGDRTLSGVAVIPDRVGWAFGFDLPDGDYQWSVAAIDAAGTQSESMRPATFTVDTTNDGPTATAVISVPDRGVITRTTPTLYAAPASDPDGDALEYRLELSQGGRFDAGAVWGRPTDGGIEFDLKQAGVKLDENRTWHTRVVTTDTHGAAAVGDIVSFFVRGAQEPPTVPSLLSPQDGDRTTQPRFEVAGSVDPDRDALSYEIRVSRDRAGRQIVARADGLALGSGRLGHSRQATWTPTERFEGTVYWTARAVDRWGAEGEWAEPQELHVGAATADSDDEPAAACSTSAGGGTSAGWLLLVCGLVTRRKSR